MRVRPPKDVQENSKNTSALGVTKDNAVFLKSTGEGFTFDHVFGEVCVLGIHYSTWTSEKKGGNCDFLGE